MVLDKNDVKKSLNGKGFQMDKKKHHLYFTYFTLKGKKTRIYTYCSHSSESDIDDYLIRRMAEQCNISKAEFIDLINCPLRQAEYEKILIGKNVL
jgi:hypothetical protein